MLGANQMWGKKTAESETFLINKNGFLRKNIYFRGNIFPVTKRIELHSLLAGQMRWVREEVVKSNWNAQF